jgi:hypothetical protein
VGLVVNLIAQDGQFIDVRKLLGREEVLVPRLGFAVAQALGASPQETSLLGGDERVHRRIGSIRGAL